MYVLRRRAYDLHEFVRKNLKIVGLPTRPVPRLKMGNTPVPFVCHQDSFYFVLHTESKSESILSTCVAHLKRFVLMLSAMFGSPNNW
uniref:Uncharacterized protein n=1 Tax=Megaselia scalaris TaxID=36166 RepID=T1GCU1_MEGSC